MTECITPDKEGIIKFFSGVANLDHYVTEVDPKLKDKNGFNAVVKEYYTNVELAAGPLAGVLQTRRVAEIRTPLSALISLYEPSDNLGEKKSFYYFEGLRSAKETHYDVWILATEENDIVNGLESFAETQATHGTHILQWDLVHPFLTGFARVIRYQNSNSEDRTPNYAEQIWEGQIQHGFP